MNHILLILLTSLGFKNNRPKHDLRKPATREDHVRSIECFIQRHFYILMMLFLAVLLITFVIVCYMIVGVSAVESGTVYNHLGDVI